MTMTDETKNKAAVALGRRGGTAGRGAAKRRAPEHYRAMQKKSVQAAKIRRELEAEPPKP
jgi:hypothetical protein